MGVDGQHDAAGVGGQHQAGLPRTAAEVHHPRALREPAGQLEQQPGGGGGTGGRPGQVPVRQPEDLLSRQHDRLGAPDPGQPARHGAEKAVRARFVARRDRRTHVGRSGAKPHSRHRSIPLPVDRAGAARQLSEPVPASGRVNARIPVRIITIREDDLHLRRRRPTSRATAGASSSITIDPQHLDRDHERHVDPGRDRGGQHRVHPARRGGQIALQRGRAGRRGQRAAPPGAGADHRHDQHPGQRQHAEHGAQALPGEAQPGLPPDHRVGHLDHELRRLRTERPAGQAQPQRDDHRPEQPTGRHPGQPGQPDPGGRRSTSRKPTSTNHGAAAARRRRGRRRRPSPRTASRRPPAWSR